MANKYWAESFYPLFLAGVNSCTYSSLADADLQENLDDLARKAIAKFKFPKVGLEFAYDDEEQDGVPKGYYFINADQITDKELLVVTEWMRVYWIEYQLGKERNYENIYADKDVKAFSGSQLISSLERAYSGAISFARKTEEDYYRVNKLGKPALGDVNAE